MIDQIISSSRVCFKQDPGAEMYGYFDQLLDFSKKRFPKAVLPEKKFTYSLNKLCETISYKQTDYIVYDRYLGQCFNKLNRIVYHEGEGEAHQYFCKLMGEEFYINNDKDISSIFMIKHHSEPSAKINDLPFEFIVKKGEICAVQESFVFYHELMHVILKFYPEMKGEVMRALSQSDRTKLIIDSIRENNISDERDFDQFIEEVTCDLIALEMTYEFYKNEGLEGILIIEAATLAFLYIRTLYDIKLMCGASYKEIRNNGASKFRYNYLRSHFLESNVFEADKSFSHELVKVYDLWEENIDMTMSFLTSHAPVRKIRDLIEGPNFESIDEDLLVQMLKI